MTRPPTGSARCPIRSRCSRRVAVELSKRRGRTLYVDVNSISPVTLSEVVELGLSAVIKGATFAEPTRTLNLVPERVFGADLVRWVESALRRAVGEPTDPGLPPLAVATPPAS